MGYYLRRNANRKRQGYRSMSVVGDFQDVQSPNINNEKPHQEVLQSIGANEQSEGIDALKSMDGFIRIIRSPTYRR